MIVAAEAVDTVIECGQGMEPQRINTTEQSTSQMTSVVETETFVEVATPDTLVEVLVAEASGEVASRSV